VQLTIPANCDGELVPEISRYPVAEVYGKRHGIKFNHLLNNSCEENHEWTRSSRKRFMRLIDRLGNILKNNLNADLLAFLKS